MTAIKKVKDKEGTQFFPVTHERAVRDDDGVTLETKLQNIGSKLGDLSQLNTTDRSNIVNAINNANSILNKAMALKVASYNSSDLLVGNINNNVVGSKITYGALGTYYSGIFPCEENALISIHTTGGQYAARGYAFCDKNGIVLATSSAGIIDTTITAPQGALFIAVNCATANLEEFELSVEGMTQERIESLESDYLEVKEYINDLICKENRLIDSSSLKEGNANNNGIGSVVTYGELADFRYGVFPCTKNNIVHITTSGGSQAAVGLAFCDSDMMILSNSDTGDISRYYIPPSDTRYIVVNCKVANLSSFSLYISGIYDDKMDLEYELSCDYTDLYVGNIQNKTTGSVIVPSTLNTFLCGIFPIKKGLRIDLYTQGGTGTSVGYAFCDENFTVIEASAGGKINTSINAPVNASFIVINCSTSSQSDFSLKINSAITSAAEEAAKAVLLYKDNRHIYSIDELSIGNIQNNTVGSEVIIGTLTTYKHGIFPCSPRMFVDIATTGGTGTSRPLAFCDKELNVLETTAGGQIDSIYVSPENTAYIVVNSLNTAESAFRLIISRDYNGCYPQIYSQPLSRIDNGTLKILFFGSSHFFDTWWYQNYLLTAAGVNSELTAFYIGGGTFNQWVNAYINNTSINCYRSTNGSAWTHSLENFADIMNEGGWDIIAFQWGVFSSIDWNGKIRADWSDIISIIKKCCSPKTRIALNGNITPALAGDLSPYPQTIDGQREWQTLCNYNHQLFMRLSGINNIAPQGALMWAMRRNASLNLSNDMATDGLHPDNGLPIYGMAALFYETFFAPICGISIDDITWLPDASTPKAQPSGSTFQSIDNEQQNIIRNLIKLALSDRFGFRTS